MPQPSMGNHRLPTGCSNTLSFKHARSSRRPQAGRGHGAGARIQALPLPARPVLCADGGRYLGALTGARGHAGRRTRASARAPLAKAVPEVPDPTVEVAFVEPSSTGDEPTKAAQQQGIRPEVVTWDQAKGGVVRLPRRGVVERRFAWAARFRRLARDSERLSETLAGSHVVVAAILMLVKAAPLLQRA